SLSDEDFSEEIFSNPLFEEEIIPMKIDQHHYNAESDLIESMLNHDSSIIPSSSNIDSLLDEFADELTLLKSIPTGIDKTDCYPENEIRLIERLLYDNSSPRPPKEFVFENSNAEIESFSPSPIPVKDSDSFMEEIDLSCTPDDPMPSGIEDDDYDSKMDILIREKLLDNYSLSLPVIESYHFDIPSFSHPPAKPLDGNTRILNIKMMGDNSEQKEDPPEVPMADNRTMAQLLQAPTVGYEDTIVILEIAATNFELKHGLINLVQNKQFFGHDKEDPHAHICYFNKITSTMRVPNVPNSTIKLMLFPFSLEGAARIWLEKEPPRSILTWDDLLSKFMNQFFPPSKMTNLRNEITRFQKRFDESFSEAWDRFNDLLRACPHHGFSELHQLDTFYNALNVNDQDS
nr:reverse transcriptase domain-containing protein [Tanacetum cinerariifolium]